MTDEKAERRLQETLRRAQENGGHTWLDGSTFLYALHKAGILPTWPWYNKVTIVAQPGHTVQLTVEHIADPRLLNLILDDQENNSEDVSSSG